jgi:murein DD-endopeptidase MepM/ murein hydrolase activator NlpD
LKYSHGQQPNLQFAIHSLFVILAIFFLLSACISDQNRKLSPTVLPTESTPLVDIQTSTPVSSQVVSNFPTATSTSIQVTQITPQVSTPDLSNLKDPGENFEAWRPPVYPVPWIPSKQDHFFFHNPIAATDIDGAFSTYGYGDVFFKDVVHTGIDIPGAIGTPILAAGDGEIIYAGAGVYRGGNNILDDPYGNAVVIEHDFKYEGQALFTLYAHLDQILVEKGDQVKTGDKIGLMGNTGRTTGPHLHFEIRRGERARDPLNYLP